MQPKENKMGTLPVKRLILGMSLPMMASMMVQALYNVVDSIFVSRINQDALTAVTLAFPLQSLMIALASGTAVGINAILSRALGERRYEKSDAAANAGIFLTFLNIIVFILIGLFLAGPFVSTQTKEPRIYQYSVTYLRIVCCLSMGIFMQMTFERLLQSTGRSLLSMISQATGAIVNIIFDPILIFGYFGFPRLGVAGAAYATVMGQFVASIIGITFNLKKNPDINLSFKGIFSPRLSVIKEIYFVGVPSILMMSIGSVMTYMMNRILIAFSSTAAAVFGAYFKLQSFFFMPVFGLNNGIIPVLAYNYGAGNKRRIQESVRFAMILAISIMALGTVIFQIFPVQLLSLFKASDEMVRIGVSALRIISLSFIVAGACIAMGSVFQAFARSYYSLVVSVARQLVVLIPVAYLLSKLGEVNLVWWAFPIAETASLAASLFFFVKLHRSAIDTL